MGVEFLETGDDLIVFVSGEIDHHSASVIRSQIDNKIQTKKFKKLTLDFKKITFMDTSGIGLILGRFKLTKSLGIYMKIINIPEKLQRIINLSGIKNLGIL